MSTDTKKWRKDVNFKKLCDIVAKNSLVCFTGAGISTGLKLKNNSSAPDWKKLLINLKESIEDNLTPSESEDLKVLLSEDATGEHLIEASSILYEKDSNKFMDALVASVDLKENETSLTHKVILDLSPRGILTYNYDVAHENALKQAGVLDAWKRILPSDDSDIIEILKSNMKGQFLFKMHGSVDHRETMVLTRESYRDLFNKYPYYKAFLQHIFTNYQLLIIGFGLSDPDFEMLLQNVFSIFGSPIQEHIVIKHVKDKSSKDTIYRLRYGLHFLYVEDFKDIPELLKDCTQTTGYILDDILTKCISEKIEDRGESHYLVRNLSDIGKRCLANILEEIIKKNISNEHEDSYSLNTETSEYVYTYGVIASATKEAAYKDFLINEVVAKSIYSEPVAHAFVHLRDILEEDDFDIVKQWLKEFENKDFKDDPENPDPHNKVYKYCETIYCLLEAKCETKNSKK